jgi:hypothetical protein
MSKMVGFPWTINSIPPGTMLQGRRMSHSQLSLWFEGMATKAVLPEFLRTIEVRHSQLSLWFEGMATKAVLPEFLRTIEVTLDAARPSSTIQKLT